MDTIFLNMKTGACSPVQSIVMPTNFEIRSVHQIPLVDYGRLLLLSLLFISLWREDRRARPSPNPAADEEDR
jgi:hypothetical protein